MVHVGEKDLFVLRFEIGDLRFERKVRLFVSDKATIGNVTGATAVPFTGDSPPS